MKFRKKLSLIKIEPKQILKNVSVKTRLPWKCELCTRKRYDDFKILPRKFF